MNHLYTVHMAAFHGLSGRERRPYADVCDEHSYINRNIDILSYGLSDCAS